MIRRVVLALARVFGHRWPKAGGHTHRSFFAN